MKNINVDLAIIGGGPAGISAGIYAVMDNANYLLIETGEPCSFMETAVNSHNFVDGFTGVEKKISGTSMKRKFLDHYSRLNGKIFKAEILSLINNGDYFSLNLKENLIIAKSVIIATGTRPKIIEVGGLKKFNKHIHFNCVSEGERYINKEIVVIGGRNSGVAAACYLYDLGCKVSLIEIKNEIQAKEKYKQWLKKRNIKIFTSASLSELIGDTKLEKIKIIINNKEKEVKADEMFLYIGREPSFDFIDFKIKLDREGYILVDAHNETSVKGLFAAGDVTPKLKQIITACGDGANAYYFANKYFQELKK